MTFLVDNSRFPFPYVLRMRVEVLPDGGKSDDWCRVDRQKFVFSRLGNRPVVRRTAGSVRRMPFLIRLSVWH